MQNLRFPDGMSEEEKQFEIRELYARADRQQVAVRLADQTAKLRSRHDLWQRQVFEVLVREIIRSGYCPTGIDWMSMAARTTPGRTAQALRILEEQGLIVDHDGGLETFATFAPGPWFANEEEELSLYRSPIRQESDWNLRRDGLGLPPF